MAQAIPRSGVTNAEYWAKHGEKLLGAFMSVANNTPPSRRNSTFATPMLSLAFALNVSVPFVTRPLDGDVRETVGGVVSGGVCVVAQDCVLWDEVLVALSYAITV